MPPKAKTNKSRRKRNYNRKRNTTRRGNITKSYLNILNDYSVFPASYPFKGEWVDTNAVGSAAEQYVTGATVRTYNLNSIFEPLSGNLTHAMLGKDELNILYRSYKVYGVEIDVLFTNPEADGMACVIYLQNPEQTYSAAGKTVSKLEEKGGCEVLYLNNTGSQKAHWKKFFPMYKLCSVSKTEHESNTEDFHGDMTGNPVKMPKMHIAIANLTDNTSKVCSFIVRLKFYGKAYEKRTIIQANNSTYVK